jgi:hypothetical protein
VYNIKHVCQQISVELSDGLLLITKRISLFTCVAAVKPGFSLLLHLHDILVAGYLSRDSLCFVFSVQRMKVLRLLDSTIRREEVFASGL